MGLFEKSLDFWLVGWCERNRSLHAASFRSDHICVKASISAFQPDSSISDRLKATTAFGIRYFFCNCSFLVSSENLAHWLIEGRARCARCYLKII